MKTHCGPRRCGLIRFALIPVILGAVLLPIPAAAQQRHLTASDAAPRMVDGWTLHQNRDMCVAEFGPDQAGTKIAFIGMGSDPDTVLVQLSNPAWSAAGEPFRPLTLTFFSLPRIVDGKILPKYPTPSPIQITAMVDKEAQAQGRLVMLMSFGRQSVDELVRLSQQSVSFGFTYQGKHLTDYLKARSTITLHLDRCRDPFRHGER